MTTLNLQVELTYVPFGVGEGVEVGPGVAVKGDGAGVVVIGVGDASTAAVGAGARGTYTAPMNTITAINTPETNATLRSMSLNVARLQRGHHYVLVIDVSRSLSWRAVWSVRFVRYRGPGCSTRTLRLSGGRVWQVELLSTLSPGW